MHAQTDKTKANKKKFLGGAFASSKRRKPKREVTEKVYINIYIYTYVCVCVCYIHALV
jgi:hypothetical protein